MIHKVAECMQSPMYHKLLSSLGSKRGNSFLISDCSPIHEQQMHKVNMYLHASGDWHTCIMYMNAVASCPLTPVRDEVL